MKNKATARLCCTVRSGLFLFFFLSLSHSQTPFILRVPLDPAVAEPRQCPEPEATCMWVGCKLGDGVWDVDIDWGFLWLLTAMRRLGALARCCSVQCLNASALALWQPPLPPAFISHPGDNVALFPFPSGLPIPIPPREPGPRLQEGLGGSRTLARS